MAQSGKSGTCTFLCWLIAIAAGLAVVWVLAKSMPMVVPLIAGFAVAVIVGIVLVKLLCRSSAAAATAAKPAKSPTQRMAEAEVAQAERAKRDAERKAAEDAAKAEAARKAAADAAAREAAAKAEAEATAARAADEAAAAAKAAMAAEAPAPAVEVKSSQLPGQQELSARKGEWKYQAEAAPAAAAPAAAADAAQPEGLAAARGGQADDLKQIKGVGPKLETLLNSLGIFHFDQIAGWAASDVAWMDDNLKGFKGRVTRDGWVDQAKILAAGGDTEFSKRVEDGDVY